MPADTELPDSEVYPYRPPRHAAASAQRGLSYESPCAGWIRIFIKPRSMAAFDPDRVRRFRRPPPPPAPALGRVGSAPLFAARSQGNLRTSRNVEAPRPVGADAASGPAWCAPPAPP